MMRSCVSLKANEDIRERERETMIDVVITMDMTCSTGKAKSHRTMGIRRVQVDVHGHVCDRHTRYVD
jgi:hypothetical protein